VSVPIASAFVIAFIIISPFRGASKPDSSELASHVSFVLFVAQFPAGLDKMFDIVTGEVAQPVCGVSGSAADDRGDVLRRSPYPWPAC
jgi:hypothetical protein